jgi:DNA-binding transcriptional ArsR family regulator
MSLHRTKTNGEHMVELFRALGEPLRAGIMARIATMDELACTTLEETLAVSKSTISYHMKILYQAGLIDIRKDGRNYFYSARREAIEEALPGLLNCLEDIAAERKKQEVRTPAKSVRRVKRA